MKKAKPKKCAYSKCGKMFTPKWSTTEKTCSNSVCQFGYLKEYNSEKEIKARLKEYKLNTTKLSVYEARARIPFQKWIRWRDRDEPCISCGATKAAQYDAGHYFSCEQYSGLIFNEMNVNKQCSYCNCQLYGNLIEYRKGLIKKYGELAVEGLDELANETRNYKYTREELIEIANKYKELLKTK